MSIRDANADEQSTFFVSIATLIIQDTPTKKKLPAATKDAIPVPYATIRRFHNDMYRLRHLRLTHSHSSQYEIIAVGCK